MHWNNLITLFFATQSSSLQDILNCINSYFWLVKEVAEHIPAEFQDVYIGKNL